MPLSDKISISSGICGASSVVDAKRIEKLNHIESNSVIVLLKLGTLVSIASKMNEKSQYKTMQIALVIYL